MITHIKEKLEEYLNDVINKTEILKSEQIQKIIYSSILLQDFTDVGKEKRVPDCQTMKIIVEMS
jgi:DNA polymerase III delta prime subunit